MSEYFNQIYHRVVSNPQVYLVPVVRVVGVFVVASIAWWVLNMVVATMKKRLGQRPFFQRNDYIFPLTRRAGHYSILILAGAKLVEFLHVSMLEKVFYALLVLLLASFVKSVFNHVVPVLERAIATRTETKMDDVILDLFRSLSGVIIYGTAIILALDLLGLNIMPLVAGAGVAGLAIGFAAKDTLSNLIAGVLLIIDRPFEVGDRIEVWSAPANSATWGDVIDIGLRATKIRATDNIVIVIPNNEIMRRDIINYTTITKEIRVRIPVGIAYEADVKRAKEAIVGIALELEWVMKDPPPKVVVKSFGDSSVNLEARVWISDPRRRIDTISHVTDRIKEVFQEQGIEIPYPKRDIFIKREETVSP
ncbi:MAG: mechanosensitive ion channel [Deltaproteobacteria bacterium]|nr:mechanosensitive ion channel [Deltaproteobacteria bacterium]MBW1930435.1 mechanosensitive ion channel [Deltaproteobacteria bacterium]MBW2025366.1 mechanosensitive ion channel [Deltaproteobacteria bacterium]RLB20690.1 MAG: hypothetical protein DRG76_10535 [Deltaproteobacteria bacterium]